LLFNHLGYEFELKNPGRLTKIQHRVKLLLQVNFAEVAEQADALRSGRSGLYAHVGSTPTFGTEIVSNFWLETFFIGQGAESLPGISPLRELASILHGR
jgi:hypothetical protein